MANRDGIADSTKVQESQIVIAHIFNLKKSNGDNWTLVHASTFIDQYWRFGQTSEAQYPENSFNRAKFVSALMGMPLCSEKELEGCPVDSREKQSRRGCGRASTRALRPKICQPPNTASPRVTSEAAKSKSMRWCSCHWSRLTALLHWCYTLFWRVGHRCGMDVMRSETAN